MSEKKVPVFLNFQVTSFGFEKVLRVRCPSVLPMSVLCLSYFYVESELNNKLDCDDLSESSSTRMLKILVHGEKMG